MNRFQIHVTSLVFELCCWLCVFFLSADPPSPWRRGTWPEAVTWTVGVKSTSTLRSAVPMASRTLTPAWPAAAAWPTTAMGWEAAAKLLKHFLQICTQCLLMKGLLKQKAVFLKIYLNKNQTKKSYRDFKMLSVYLILPEYLLKFKLYLENRMNDMITDFNAKLVWIVLDFIDLLQIIYIFVF